jgi:hypothetical protein
LTDDLGHTKKIAERLRTRTTLVRLSLLNQANGSAEELDCQQISVTVQMRIDITSHIADTPEVRQDATIWHLTAFPRRRTKRGVCNQTLE